MTVKKPWGEYEDIIRTEEYVLKTIRVAPKKRLSLQFHHHRDEYWVCVKGTPIVDVDHQLQRLNVGDSVWVQRRLHHRLINDTDEYIEILELQHGRCSEDDIIRLEDDYER